MDQLWDKYRRNSNGWERDSIARVHTRIYLGSAKTCDVFTFSNLNITHVVNCAEEWVSAEWFRLEFPDRLACIGAIDHRAEDITKWYPMFSNIMNRFLADPDCKNIYVHCECGINRSAFLILIYMCLKFGSDIEIVAKNILMQRPCALTNPSFRRQCIEYIKKHE
jgi:protein-tyrosine phosphatase